ncbi:MAG TPA: 2-oxoglutarate and iron-dependent oxygenase domain-containing protein [Mycobacteriales bacterium]|nr:2-oxoglutarate and iron-dependent oxygenase domain-containing protein [Mycobacteriales bacterium]
MSVPVIDISALVDSGTTAEVAATAAEIDAACSRLGFFVIAGHGVAPALRRDLDAAARAFFALPDAEKARIAMPHAGIAWRGWFPVGGELTSGRPDLKEGIYFGTEHSSEHPGVVARRPLHGANLFPERPESLRQLVLDYLDEMTRLAQTVLEGVAVGLGLPREWFRDRLTADPVVLFRIFHYPPAPPASDDWGVGEHTDYGLLTLLGQDGNAGLQVKGPDGWTDVPPDPDTFVCNLGDMLERLTGGRYRSTPHRVRNLSGAERLSYPFFLDPSWEAVVDRLPVVERPPDDDESAASRWDHASVHGFAGTYGDYLTQKVAKVFPELARP